MKKRLRLLVGAFLFCMVLIGALLGFAIVDYSTGYYMPGTFAPLLQVSEVGPGGVSFVVMGKDYHIHREPLQQAEAALSPWRLFLPVAPQWASMAAAEAYRSVEDQVRIWKQTDDDPWDSQP